MEEGDEEDEEDHGEEVPQETLKQCLDKFGSPDFIMEPEIFSQLKKYFQSGGNPEQVKFVLFKKTGLYIWLKTFLKGKIQELKW